MSQKHTHTHTKEKQKNGKCCCVVGSSRSEGKRRERRQVQQQEKSGRCRKSALHDHDYGRALRYHDGDDNRPLRKAPQSNGTMRFDRP
jgi:hypothetical protein